MKIFFPRFNFLQFQEIFETIFRCDFIDVYTIPILKNDFESKKTTGITSFLNKKNFFLFRRISQNSYILLSHSNW